LPRSAFQAQEVAGQCAQGASRLPGPGEGASCLPPLPASDARKGPAFSRPLNDSEPYPLSKSQMPVAVGHWMPSTFYIRRPRPQPPRPASPRRLASRRLRSRLVTGEVSESGGSEQEQCSVPHYSVSILWPPACRRAWFRPFGRCWLWLTRRLLC
jgi:hypothetical protein